MERAPNNPVGVVDDDAPKTPTVGAGAEAPNNPVPGAGAGAGAGEPKREGVTGTGAPNAPLPVVVLAAAGAPNAGAGAGLLPAMVCTVFAPHVTILLVNFLWEEHKERVYRPAAIHTQL